MPIRRIAPRDERMFTTKDRQFLQMIRTDREQAMEMFLRVQDRDHKQVIPFKLNRCQKSLHDQIQAAREFNIRRSTLAHAEDPSTEITDGPVRFVIGKCRRGGVSTYLIGNAFLDTGVKDNFRVMVMAHRGANAVNIARYVDDFYSRWPQEHMNLRQAAISESANGYRWPNKSWFCVQTAGGSDVARSYEFDVYHFSEAAFYPSYAEVNTAIAAAPKHSWVFEESTANGPTGGFYDRWREALTVDEANRLFDKRDWTALSRWNGFFRFFFSWLDDPAYREFIFEKERGPLLKSLTEYEQSLMGRGVTLEQLKWRRSKIRLIGKENESGLSDEQYFMQEYPADPEEMFQASGDAVYDPHILAQMRTDAKKVKPKAWVSLSANSPPVRETQAFKSNLIVYEPPKHDRMYVVGADTGNGLASGDWSVAIVLDRTDGTTAREVALLRGKIGAEHFGEMVTFLAEFYNNAFIVPEASGPGQSTCIQILNNRYPHVYTRRSLDTVSDEKADKSFTIGFLTLVNTKATIIEASRRAIKDGLLEFVTPEVIEEHTIFKKVKHGRSWDYSAPDGDHDDTVIAGALAYFGHVSPAGAPPVTAVKHGRRYFERSPDPAREAREADHERFLDAMKLKLKRAHQRSKKAVGRDWQTRRE